MTAQAHSSSEPPLKCNQDDIDQNQDLLRHLGIYKELP